MRQHMDRADRAKQFMPFSALKGYEDAIAERAKIKVERVILGEDAQAELDGKLRVLQIGDGVSALYYRDGAYVQARGRLSGIDRNKRLLLIGGERVPIDDLRDIAQEP